MILVTIYANSQFMIPLPIRQRLNIKPGDYLAFFIKNDKELVMCKTSAIQDVIMANSKNTIQFPVKESISSNSGD